MSAQPTGLPLYDKTADAAAAAVISRYSTSFGMACRLLGPRVRGHVRSIYALVRVADEVVDGPARDAGLTPAQERQALDDLAAETAAAIDRGFSTNLIVHAFARTARECRIGAALIDPFFASMRTDLDTRDHDDASHDAYVYGSAEVVGLMCLQTFVHAGRPGSPEPTDEVVAGARRLGAAFQDVNFLRDLAHDADSLGRDYLGVGATSERLAVLDRIDADLDAAARVVPLLPADCRRAVTAAHDLFAELSARLRRSDGASTTRVRVPDAVKAAILVRAAAGRPPRRAGDRRTEPARSAA